MRYYSNLSRHFGENIYQVIAFIFEKPENSFGFVWAEINTRWNIPATVDEIKDNIHRCLKLGIPVATSSIVAISYLGWMVRHKQISLPCCLVWVDKNDGELVIPFDTNGELLRGFPIDDKNNPVKANLYFQYD